MKKAFTLIELLVVISIIAILAALALPAVEKAMAPTKSPQIEQYVEEPRPVEKKRLIQEWQGGRLSLITDTKSGREFLTQDGGGFFEITDTNR